MLNAVHTGDRGDRPPLLIAHGLFGSARNWGVIARRLSDARQVITVDMRNHGESPWHDTHSYPELAADLAEVLEKVGPADVIGHSMGGKAAMVLALTVPHLVRGLLVSDIAPVGYGHTQMPLIDAMRSVDLTAVNKRSDALGQLAGIEPDVAAFLLQSLDVARKRWRLNLDVLASEMPAIMGFPQIEGVFSGPSLFLSGAESDYVLPAHRPVIKGLFPSARFAKIPQAGHWLHAERPRAFEAAARAFLMRDG